MINGETSFSIPDIYATLGISKSEAFSVQEGNAYQTVHSVIKNKKLWTTTVIVGVPGVVAHLFWK